MSDDELGAIANVTLDFLQDWSSGSCEYFKEHGPIQHSSKCSSQGGESEYCDCLAGFAHLCASAHEANWYPFSTCLYAHNGSPWSEKGLEADSTFEKAIQECAEASLSQYSFAALRECYLGDEGAALGQASAARSSAYGATAPVWAVVNGELVESKSMQEDKSIWAARVKAKLCSEYSGTLPSACSSFV